VQAYSFNQFSESFFLYVIILKICSCIFIYCCVPEGHGGWSWKYARLFSSIVVPRRGMAV